MTTPTIAYRSEEWQEERRSYVGASDSPVLVGASPYRSAYQLWLEKTGQSEPTEETPITRWGHRVEQVAAEIYTEETGRRLRRINRVQRHRQYPFIACNPDRAVVGERRLVQVKSSWREWDAVPDHVIVQVQHEMGVTRYDVADIALLTGFAGFRVYEVPRDDLFIHRLFTIVRAWWQRHVVEGIEPERTGQYLNALRGQDVMEASAAQAEAVRALRDVREAITQLKAREENLEEWIKRSMAGAFRLDGRDYGFGISWKPGKDGTKTDWQAVARAYRTLLAAQVDGEALRSLSSEEQRIARQLDPASLDGLEALHTTTKPGSRPFRVTFREKAPTEEE